MEIIDVWFEALTAKQSLLFSIIAEALMKNKISYLITTRNYDYIISLLKMRKKSFVTFGRYGGLSKRDKMNSSLKRMKMIFNFLKNYKVRVHLSFTSPDSTRIAYGLGIPIILLSDSPHSDIVNKLTIPLANKLIVPICTYREFLKYRIDTEIISFDGVFETVWTKSFKPNKKVLGKLKPYSYVIVRLEEIKASYYPIKGQYTFMTYIINYLLKNKIKILVYPRYRDQRIYIKEKYREHINKLILIPKYAKELQSLEYYSLMVITGGTSIAHESSLLGVPSITIFPKKLPVTEYIIKKGFPLFATHNKKDIINLIHDIFENNEKYRVKNDELRILHEKLEDPTPLILNNIKLFL